MKRQLLIPIISLLVFACSKSDELYHSESGEISQHAPITITVDSKSLTRGTIVDSEETMATVGMFCTHYKTSNPSNPEQWMENEKFSYNQGAWSGESNIKWGHESVTDKYSFYAYSPYAADGANGITPSMENGSLKIDYTVPSTVADQKDLMVAIPRINIYPQMGGKVNMKFKHALAKVQFSVKGDGTKKIQSIEIKDIISQGTLTFDNSAEGYSWAPKSTISDFTATTQKGDLTDTNPNSTATNITSTKGYLFMLPQDASEKKVIVTFNDNSNANLTLPANQTWKAGGSYNYVVTVEKSFNGIDYSDKGVVNNLLGRADTDLLLSNCYIVDSKTNSGCIIPVGSRINTYWGDADYDGNEQANKIGSDWTTNDTYTIDIVWHQFTPGTVTNQDFTFSKVMGKDGEAAMKVEFTDKVKNVKGNMVIAVKKGGNIVWSWHLWITDYSPYGDSSGNYTDPTTKMTWMGRDIGNVGLEVKTLYYQWGRKDPSLVKKKNDIIDVPSTGYTIKLTVQNPHIFYANTERCDDGTWMHSWADNKLEHCDTKKSIFDPSPVGFMVPCSTSSTGFVSPFSENARKNVSFNRLGYLSNIKSAYSKGSKFYWTTYAGVLAGNAYHLHDENDYGNYGINRGMPIRPILESYQRQ